MISIVSALLATVVAASNFITSPVSGTSVNAGEVLRIRWNDLAGDTATLLLKSGDADNLQTASTIVSDTPNRGAIDWTVPRSIASGQYAIEIDAGDDVSYSTYFEVVGTTVESSSISEFTTDNSTTAAPTATPSANISSAVNISSSANVSTSASSFLNTSSYANSSSIATLTSNSTVSSISATPTGANSTITSGSESYTSSRIGTDSSARSSRSSSATSSRGVTTATATASTVPNSAVSASLSFVALFAAVASTIFLM